MKQKGLPRKPADGGYKGECQRAELNHYSIVIASTVEVHRHTGKRQREPSMQDAVQQEISPAAYDLTHSIQYEGRSVSVSIFILSYLYYFVNIISVKML